MQYIYTYSEWLASIADGIILVYYNTAMLGSKETNRYWKKVLAAAVIAVLAQFMQDYLGVQILLIAGAVFGYAVLELQGGLWNKLFHAIVSIVGCSAMSIILLFLLNQCMGVDLAELTVMGGGVVRVIALVMIKSLSFMMAYILVSRFGRDINMKWYEWLLILIFISITAVITYLMVNIAVEANLSSTNNMKMLTCEMLLVTAILVSFVIIRHITRQNQYESDNKALMVRLEAQKTTVTKTRAAYEEIRKTKHDLSRILNGIRTLMNQGRSEEALAYVNQLAKQVESEKVIHIADNEIISAVVNEKLGICKANGINFQLQITAAIPLAMELDTAVLLSNLLDNCIEAEEKLPDSRSIHLQIFQYKRDYNLVVQNPIAASVLESNPELQTSKSDVRRHGIGMKSIRDTVAKYHGELQVIEENSYFKVHVIFPNCLINCE